MNVLALIPARGGSKGIPNKNIIEIAGKKLIGWTIEQAIQCPLINRVIVSTDSIEIAKVAREYGAETPFLRPQEIAQDQSTDFEAFDHALRWLQINEKYTPELVVHLRPTGPARKIETINRAIKAMIDNPTHTALRSISLSSQNPYKMWKYVSNTQISPLINDPSIKDSVSSPRQKLPLTYWQNGYIDIVRPRTILDEGSMTGNLVLPFKIEEELAELDYPEDIEAVEKLLLGMSSSLITSESNNDLDAVTSDEKIRYPT